MSLWMHCSNRTTTSLLVSCGQFDICEGLRPQKNTSNWIYYLIFIGKKKDFDFEREATRVSDAALILLSHLCVAHHPIQPTRVLHWRGPGEAAHAEGQLAHPRGGKKKKKSKRGRRGCNHWGTKIQTQSESRKMRAHWAVLWEPLGLRSI